MPRTPDRNPNVTEYNAESLYEDYGLADPTIGGTIRYRGVAFRHADGLGVYDPRSPWAGILDGPLSDVAGKVFYKTITYVTGIPVPSVVSFYSDFSKTTLVYTKSYTYSASIKILPTQIIYRRYALDGVTVLATINDTYTFTGVLESGRTRAYS